MYVSHKNVKESIRILYREFDLISAVMIILVNSKKLLMFNSNLKLNKFSIGGTAFGAEG